MAARADAADSTPGGEGHGGDSVSPARRRGDKHSRREKCRPSISTAPSAPICEGDDGGRSGAATWRHGEGAHRPRQRRGKKNLLVKGEGRPPGSAAVSAPSYGGGGDRKLGSRWRPGKAGADERGENALTAARRGKPPSQGEAPPAEAEERTPHEAARYEKVPPEGDGATRGARRPQ